MSVLSLLALPWIQPANCLQECGSSSGIIRCYKSYTAVSVRSSVPSLAALPFSCPPTHLSRFCFAGYVSPANADMCHTASMHCWLPHRAFTAQGTLELKTPKPIKLYAQVLRESLKKMPQPSQSCLEAVFCSFQECDPLNVCLLCNYLTLCNLNPCFLRELKKKKNLQNFTQEQKLFSLSFQKWQA